MYLYFYNMDCVYNYLMILFSKTLNFIFAIYKCVQII